MTTVGGEATTNRKRGLIPNSVQYRRLREFCDAHGFEPHTKFQLFRRAPEEPWILYRRGLPGGHKVAGRDFPGWTFDMSLSSPDEDNLCKCVCFHFVTQIDIPEKIKFSAKPDYTAYAAGLKDKRLYVSEAQNRIFDSGREQFLHSLRSYPIFDK